MKTSRLWTVIAVLALGVLACSMPSLPGGAQPAGSGNTDGTGEGSGNAPGLYDGGDGLSTIAKGPLTVGGAAGSSNIDSWFDADNWTFEGQAGQQVTIFVEAVGTSDPNVTLIDPQGNKLGEDDDSGGGKSAQLVMTLPSNGTYTIRVDIFDSGDYNVSVK